MEYLFIAGVLIAMQVKGYFGRKTSGLLQQTGDAVLFNFVRAVLCVLIGIVPITIEAYKGLFRIDGKMLAICLLGGTANAINLVFWILAARRNSYAVIDVVLALGSIIPVLLCAVFFGESISWLKMIGFGLIVSAVVIMALPNYGFTDKKKAKKEGYDAHKRKEVTFLGISLVVITAVFDGFLNFSQQVYKQNFTAGGLFTSSVTYPKSVFNFYLYLFSCLVLFVIYILFFLIEKSKEDKSLKTVARCKAKFVLKTLPYSIVMALCLYLVTYFQMIAANEYNVPSQILYPIIKGGSLVLANFMSVIFFGEKLTVRRIVGMSVALVGIVIMNVI